MSENWVETTVGQWSPFSYGKGLPERTRKHGQVPVYGSNGVVGFHNEAAVKGPGVIVGRKGTVGSVALSREPFWPIDTTFYVTEDAHRDIEFTAALLATLGLEERNSHTAVPGLSRDDAHQLHILVPPLAEQLRISAALRALDDRIASLQRLQALLGKMILAESHLAFENRGATAEMSLVDAVRLVNGGAYTKDATGTGRMVVRIKELNSGPSETTVYNNITVPDDKTVRPGDVLFAWSGSLGVWRWYRDEAIVNQHIFKVLARAHPVWLGYVHIQDALTDFQDIAEGKATTMGHITKDHLQRARVPVLTDGELADLTTKVEPLWEYQLRAGREILSLQNLRDFLLPRLLSGELRVAELDDAEPAEATP